MTKTEQALQNASETRALLIGPNVLAKLPALFAEQFPQKKAVIVADVTTFGVAGRAASDILRAGGIAQEVPHVFTDRNLYAEYSYLERLEKLLRQSKAIPIAVGSGTINDLTKLAAHRTGRPYLCIGTAASMDGYTAYGASITYRGNKQTFTCPAPKAVLADISIIAAAPPALTASGYADLFAKVPAGADWILADALGVEPIDEVAWGIVQDQLLSRLAHPEGFATGEEAAVTLLVEGLMLSGFAMQYSRTSRPASGAEHQFSHLWDMEHHVHKGVAPAHGFKVGIATLYLSMLYEQLLKHPMETLDIEGCCARWPEWEQQEKQIVKMFHNTDFVDTAMAESQAKYITRSELSEQLARLKETWPEIKERLSRQLLPSAEVRRRLHLAGAPVEPEDIGISRQRLRDSFLRAWCLRRRFTVLDIAVRTSCLDRWLEEIFGKNLPK